MTGIDMRALIILASITLAAAMLASARAEDHSVNSGAGGQGDLPAGYALIYRKSNLDGSNAGKIAVYYAGNHVIESFKWHEGGDHATVVRARINPDTLNVEQFQVWSFARGGETSRAAVLQTDGDDVIHVSLGEHRQSFDNGGRSWHSYDFDFASLGYAYRFLSDKEKTYRFHVNDLDLSQDPPRFKDFGEVALSFEGREVLAGRSTRRYSLNGAGLDYRGGTIWFDDSSHHLAAFEIAKPDEPGYESGKLVLIEAVPLGSAAWEAFKLHAVSAGGNGPAASHR